jgi:hypothetical protein
MYEFVTFYIRGMLVARPLATAVLIVRTQTSLKNHKGAKKAKEWPTTKITLNN